MWYWTNKGRKKYYRQHGQDRQIAGPSRQVRWNTPTGHSGLRHAQTFSLLSTGIQHRQITLRAVSGSKNVVRWCIWWLLLPSITTGKSDISALSRHFNMWVRFSCNTLVTVIFAQQWLHSAPSCGISTRLNSESFSWARCPLLCTLH